MVYSVSIVKLRKLGIIIWFQNFRKKRILKLLYRTVGLNQAVDVTLYDHSPLPPLLKLLIFGIAYAIVFSVYGEIAALMEGVIGFFRLSDIYNFTFPDSVFFHDFARRLVHAIFLFYGGFFVYSLLPVIFSLLVVYPDQKKLYYIKNTLLARKLYIIETPAIRLTVLHQNLAERVLGFGTVEIRDNHGVTLYLRSIHLARRLVGSLEELKR